MALDARLRSVELLTLAAMRVRARQVSAPPRQVELQILYYDLRTGEEELGERYTYELPTPAPGGAAC
jgi:hypothetical protein